MFLHKKFYDAQYCVNTQFQVRKRASNLSNLVKYRHIVADIGVYGKKEVSLAPWLFKLRLIWEQCNMRWAHADQLGAWVLAHTLPASRSAHSSLHQHRNPALFLWKQAFHPTHHRDSRAKSRAAQLMCKQVDDTWLLSCGHLPRGARGNHRLR